MLYLIGEPHLVDPAGPDRICRQAESDMLPEFAGPRVQRKMRRKRIAGPPGRDLRRVKQILRVPLPAVPILTGPTSDGTTFGVGMPQDH